jgi:hypothetical protein
MAFFKKTPLYALLIVILASISISLLNTEDMSWQANVKSYMGLMIAFILLVMKIVFRIK